MPFRFVLVFLVLVGCVFACFCLRLLCFLQRRLSSMSVSFFLAFAGALRVSDSTIKGCDVVGRIDNNPSRDSIISGGTSSSHATPSVHDILMVEEALGIRLWVARVPSPSNISDAPSRLQC